MLFGLESMYHLSFKLPKILEASNFKILSVPEGNSFSIQYQSGEPKPFIGILKRVSEYLNLFLRETEGRV